MDFVPCDSWIWKFSWKTDCGFWWWKPNGWLNCYSSKHFLKIQYRVGLLNKKWETKKGLLFFPTVFGSGYFCHLVALNLPACHQPSNAMWIEKRGLLLQIGGRVGVGTVVGWRTVVECLTEWNIRRNTMGTRFYPTNFNYESGLAKFNFIWTSFEDVWTKNIVATDWE